MSDLGEPQKIGEQNNLGSTKTQRVMVNTRLQRTRLQGQTQGEEGDMASPQRRSSRSRNIPRRFQQDDEGEIVEVKATKGTFSQQKSRLPRVKTTTLREVHLAKAEEQVIQAIVDPHPPLQALPQKVNALLVGEMRAIRTNIRTVRRAHPEVTMTQGTTMETTREKKTQSRTHLAVHHLK